MNRVGPRIFAFFGVSGIAMMLVGSALNDRGGAVGDAGKVVTMIGLIWILVPMLLLVVHLLAGSAARRDTRHHAELRETPKDPDVA